MTFGGRQPDQSSQAGLQLSVILLLLDGCQRCCLIRLLRMRNEFRSGDSIMEHIPLLALVVVMVDVVSEMDLRRSISNHIMIVVAALLRRGLGQKLY